MADVTARRCSRRDVSGDGREVRPRRCADGGGARWRRRQERRRKRWCARCMRRWRERRPRRWAEPRAARTRGCESSRRSCTPCGVAGPTASPTAATAAASLGASAGGDDSTACRRALKHIPAAAAAAAAAAGAGVAAAHHRCTARTACDPDAASPDGGSKYALDSHGTNTDGFSRWPQRACSRRVGAPVASIQASGDDVSCDCAPRIPPAAKGVA